MQESGILKTKHISKRGKLNVITVVMLCAILILSLTANAWFAISRGLVAYAPISSPEALYIGAGHRDIVNDTFEDIRYLYFNGIDATDGKDYYDYVFCVYGKCVSGYLLQLAYTTNNQFTYEIYTAKEETVASPGSVAYTTHTDTPQTFYYSIDTTVNSGNPIAGRYLNGTTVNGEFIANSTYHTDTYDTYNLVDKYAEPLYWQTSAAIPGDARADFVSYYILRVCINGKSTNDRETDVICITAKSSSVGN
ncbi:MAG: hypothetical protein IK086_02715 [Clostridia bacterium]|nr:hypothetical protein [Clostridia bacterium]